MTNYKWKVEILYESRQEFKDTMAAYAVQTARNIKFKKCDLRLYVCFDACKKSFQHYRPFVSLHGCFSKTPQGGQLLTAIGRDPNDQIIPIAYAVFEVETKESWGLLPAFEEIILRVDNRFCMRHLYSNFKEKFPGLELKNKIWIQLYQKNIMPIIRKKLEKMTRLDRDWRPYCSAPNKYEFMCGLDKFVVDLAAVECSCRKWQMSGIPCAHAISCINFKGLDLESYEDDCYKKDTYLKCYKEVIHPLNRLDLWERTQYDDVMAPPYRRPSHRPVKKTKRGLGDEENRSQNHLSRRGQIQRCSNYGAVGYKKGGCTKPKKRVYAIMF
ncbi:hypothetical protein Ahy_B02g058473 [Arachis hypogaea]|uniref:SWIM-type domain-containing protein n=1 Tax=Arachis hypogaea TaxID=3818 RepID=A0A445AEP8_ARAHY|nr:hypothetical protein Ahy_B02g058473 [Arachis hypogaea]